MKRVKRFIASLSLLLVIGSILFFVPLVGHILTALSRALHYSVLALVWLLCQPVRLFVRGKQIVVSYREPIPTFEWKPVRPLS